MMIESVRLHRFRNYEDEVITFPKAIILLYGRNGQGKTNLLESLYMGGIGKSYRGIADADLISWNQDQASVIIQFRRSETRQQLKIILSKTAKKELWVNETKVPRRNLSGRSTKSCSRRTTCSSSRAARPCGAGSWTWRFPRSAGPITRNCCSITGLFPSAISC